MSLPLAEEDVSPEKNGVEASVVNVDIEVSPDGILPENEEGEVFRTDAQVNYRTMGWFKASIMFAKFQIATGVLSLPGAFHDLGAIPAVLLVFTYGFLITYGALIFGKFRSTYPNIHSVGDAGTLIGGRILGETIAWLYFLSWVLPAGVTMLGVSIAFNALSDHAICTLAFTAIAAVICTIPALLPKFGHIGILTWIGFITLYVAIMVVVIAVSLQDRPPAAPPTGDYELGFYLVSHPTFSVGLAASNLILTSYGGTTAFISAAAEMKNPKKDYNRSVYIAMIVTTLTYFVLPLIVYKYCGQYVASPALGSAGPLIKKISYGIALPGLAVTCILFLHTAGKFIMVKLLRGTRHLQERTWQHNLTWFGSVTLIAIVAFVLATGIPFFSELLSILVLFVAPNTVSLPMLMWFYDNRRSGRKAPLWKNAFHGVVLVAGIFFGIGGFICACINIHGLFVAGELGVAFTCADNS